MALTSSTSTSPCSRRFHLIGRADFQFRVEAFNVTSTVNFANPNASLGGAGSGTISNTANSYNPRLIQFAGKIQF